VRKYNSVDYLFSLLIHLGNVYLSERFGHRIRKISVASGTITTVAGTGASSYGGDGGEATAAALYRPCGVTLDSSGSDQTSRPNTSIDCLSPIS